MTKIGNSLSLKIGEGSGAAAERIVPGAGAVEGPMLGKGNYQEWALLMQVALEALELWDAVEKAIADRALDRRALSAILRGVPQEIKVGRCQGDGEGGLGLREEHARQRRSCEGVQRPAADEGV
ncbi:unnamed protein product [Urochloa humidicola]